MYTITIVRNLGIPISFTVKSWKVRFFLLLIIGLSSFVAVEAFRYLRLMDESENLRQALSESRKKIELLSTQIARYDNKLYQEEEETVKEQLPSNLETELLDQPEVNTEGAWVTERNNLLTQDLQEGTNLEVTNLKSRVKGDDLLLSVEITNTSKQPKDVGGYINIALINNDVSPPVYKSATGGSLGKNGFPSTYKSGRQYLIKAKRRTRTYRINRVQLTEANEYYTDALLLVYSYKGRLLSKQLMPLDRKIFLEQ
jgi:hypothetical protein